MAYVPLDCIDDLESVKTKLTVIPKTYGEEIPTPIFLYKLDTEGYIGLPIDWGISNFPHLSFEDRTSKGNGLLLNAAKKVDPNHPKAPKGQDVFIDNIIKACSKYYTCFAVAQTGSGKSVSALAAASHFNMRTLVVVDRKLLANQWKDEIIDKIGIDPSRIALISGRDSKDMKASICVGIVKTLVDNDFGEDFYRSFGTVILDEVHAYGSEKFSKVVNLFNSTIKIGMTATDERGDDAEFCYRSALGPHRAVSTAESMPLTVYKVTYANKPLYGDNPQYQKSQLVKDVSRNRMIAEMVAEAYQNNRQILVASDRIEHLEELMERSINLGVPKEVCGLLTGQRTENGKRVKVTIQESEKIKKERQVIFSTYGICNKGLDIPRLDYAIAATPRSAVTQYAGRVRRLYDNKPDPILVDIVDEHSHIFKNQYRKRYKDYMSIDATVLTGVPKWQ